MLGVAGEPWPRWASTAHRDTRRTRQAAVTVRTSQPTRAAIVARVTATWRPVAWSACSAITAAIDTSVAAVIDTRSWAHSWLKAGECAHRRRPSSQPARLVHIGARGAQAPARCTHSRRRSLASARTICGLGAAEATDEPSGVGRVLARCVRAMERSRFAHRSRGESGAASRHALP